MRVSTLHVLTAFALLTSCGGGDKPTITTFASSAMMVNEGGTVTLSWSVKDADTITITAAPGGPVTPTSGATGMVTSAAINANTTFTLKATNKEGDASRTVMVTVQKMEADPVIDAFTGSPTMVAPGGAVTLTWMTTDATAVDIAASVGGAILTDGDPDGTNTVNPQETTTYTLTAKGAGTPATRTVTITVVEAGPVVSSFTANPTTVIDGETSVLSWNVMAATMISVVSADGTEVYSGADLNGQQTVTPAVANLPGTATYRLTAIDAENRMATGMVTISVNPVGGPVINLFLADPTSISVGETSTLRWDVTGGTTVEILDGATSLTTSTDAAGTFVVTPLATTTYTLVARDAGGGMAMGMATVTVNAAAPPILAWEANPLAIAIGGTTTLAWRTATATSVQIQQGGVELFETALNMGTFDVVQTATVASYVLEVSNTLGSNTATVTVYAHEAPSINDFTVLPLTIPTGGSVTATITWDVSSVASLSLLANGQPVAGFPAVNVSPMTTDSAGVFTLNVAASTQFTLFATSAGGNASQTITVSVLVGKTEPNNSPVTATPLPGGSAVAGEISVAGDLDFYAVTVTAGSWLVLETSDGLGGCTMDTFLEVYSSTNAVPANRIALNDDINGAANRCSRITPFADPNVISTVAVQDLAAGTYYVLVRAFSSTATGQYVLTAQVGPAECGNTLFETTTNEECEDGNTTDNDGCSSLCEFEVNPVTIVAPGGTVTVPLTPGAFSLVQVDITVAGQSITATAADVGLLSCSTDTALALLDSDFVLIGQKADGGPSGATEDCASIYFAEDRFAVGLAVGTYYLAVVNEGAAAGTVELGVTIVESVCGDRVRTPINEGCDDGNTAGGDECNATCQHDATTLPAPAPVAITERIAFLGEHDFYPVTVTSEIYLVANQYVPNQATDCVDDDDLVLRDSAGTELATAELNVGFACATLGPSAGTRLLPGNYVIEVFDIDDNGTNPGYELVLDSRPVDVCGNDVIETGEVCDDGGTVDGDGCSALCQPDGTLGLETEPNSTFATANALGPTGVGISSMSGAISVAADLDVYSFVVPAGQTLDLSSRTYSVLGDPTSSCSNAIDTELVLYSPTFVQLDIDDDIGGGNLCSEIIRTALTEGTYFMLVRYWDNTGTPATGVGTGTGLTGTYFLDVELQ